MLIAHPFNLEELFMPTLTIFLLGGFIVYLYSKKIILSFFLSFIKAFIFFIYFHYFFNGNFTFLDDWTYLRISKDYFYYNHNTLTLLFFNPIKFFSIFSSQHILYYLWNVLSFYFFGVYYFSPVALNITLTFFTSLILYKLLNATNIKQKYAIWCSLFYLLHWNTLSWSSILNLKDFLVQFLLLFLLYSIIMLIKVEKNRIIYIVYTVITIILLEVIRFYLPFFIFLSYIFYKLFLYIKRYRKYYEKIIVSGFILLFLIPTFAYIILQYLNSDMLLFLESYVNPLTGLIRFLLTPIPFHLEKAYNFLVFSSFLNWLSFPFFVYGTLILWKQNNKFILFLYIALAIIAIFYGSYSGLQGPRHRIQLIPYISTFQLIGFLAFFYGKKQINKIFSKNGQTKIPN